MSKLKSSKSKPLFRSSMFANFMEKTRLARLKKGDSSVRKFFITFRRNIVTRKLTISLIATATFLLVWLIPILSEVVPKFWDWLWYSLNLDRRRAAIATLATIIGSFAVFLNLILVFLNLVDSQRKTKLTEDRLRQDRQLSESRLASEIFSQAVEQISDERTAICLGGIYSLSHLLENFPEYYFESIEILTALIREKSNLRQRIDDKNDSGQSDQSEHKQIDTIVRAALKVIGRADSLPKIKPNLNGVNFSKIDLSNLSLKFIDLRSSIFHGTNFSRTTFYGSDLSNSDFRDAQINFANFQGASLCDTDFREISAPLKCDFSKSHLVGARLNKADLRGSNFDDSSLLRADLAGALLSGASFRNVNFFQANLCGAEFGPSDAYFQSQSLSFGPFSRMRHKAANLSGAKLHSTKLQGTKFQGVNFEGVTSDKTSNWQESIGLPTALNIPDEIKSQLSASITSINSNEDEKS